MKFDFLKNARSFIHYYCPECGKEMETAYIMDTVFICLSCNKVWELRWQKSSSTVESVKADGWLRESIINEGVDKK